MLTVLVKPALRSAEGDPLLPSDPRKRHTVLEVQAQELETLKSTCAGLLRELRQGGWSAIQDLLVFLSLSQKRGDTVGELSSWFLIGQNKVLKGSNQDNCF